MAEGENITVAPGVTRDECKWHWRLGGTMDDLLASGLAKPEWFPNGIDCNKRGYIKRQKNFIVDGREVSVRRPKRGLCTVYFSRSPEEMKAYEKEHWEEEQIKERQRNEENRRKYIEEAEERTLQRYADALSTPGGLKAEVWDTAKLHFSMLAHTFGLLNNPSHPHYNFQRNVKERARELIFELRELFDENDVTPTRSVRARADIKLQTFLQTMVRR